MFKLIKNIFPSRKKSLIYLMTGKLPSLIDWYFFSYFRTLFGSFHKNDKGKIVWLEPYWYYTFRTRNQPIFKTTTYENGKVTQEDPIMFPVNGEPGWYERKYQIKMKFKIPSYVIPSDFVSNTTFETLTDLIGYEKSNVRRYKLVDWNSETDEYLIQCSQGSLWVKEHEIERWNPKEPLSFRSRQLKLFKDYRKSVWS